MFSYLLTELDEVQEYDILSFEPYRGMERKFSLGFEHGVEKGCSHVGKMLGSEVVLSRG